MGKEAAKTLARYIIETLPDEFKTTVQEWYFIEGRIVKLLMENPQLVIGSISEEDWLEYRRSY